MLYPKLVPNFSPLYGGSDASVLFILEAPGPQVISSRVICTDNPDQTARKMSELLEPFPRKDVLIWNIVPWINCENGKKKNPNKAQIEAGALHLNNLISQMPRLRALVLVGKSAWKAKKLLMFPENKIFETWHPSPLNRKKYTELEQQYKDLYKHLYSSHPREGGDPAREAQKI